ncbi:hypothetical protein QC761_0067510 [Podospora bellae-mahoneyi]|uniref:Uncharacterized protein n=1 Tax=Podospora bellae-mahoneyi TaxID=2093777 RepID=A0ABR0FKJ7_9PEZI|nr:hypothetical protein QC761_0067510 [Podospora bellae-mahoneyi]
METKPIDFGDIYEITIPQDIATRNFNDLENEGGWCDLRMEGKACYEYLDCMARAELDYATETHAYNWWGGGKGLKVIVPQFNGNFTFEVETHVPERTAKWVRMVLMDHYKGA